jgi:adenylate kinase family enzyme
VNPTLIFIAGAPGVGKSTVARSLMDRLPDTVWLDGDDLWRMSPFRVDETTTAMVERNIAAVLREFLQGGFRYVVLSWVLHRQDIVDRIIGGLDDLPHDFHHFALVCDETELVVRRGENVSDDRARFVSQRQQQIRETGALLVDTTNRSVAQVVNELTDLISKV